MKKVKIFCDNFCYNFSEDLLHIFALLQLLPLPFTNVKMMHLNSSDGNFRVVFILRWWITAFLCNMLTPLPWYWYWHFLFLNKARQITSNSHTSKARVKNFRMPRGSTHTAKPHTNITTCHQKTTPPSAFITSVSFPPSFFAKRTTAPLHNLPTNRSNNTS